MAKIPFSSEEKRSCVDSIDQKFPTTGMEESETQNSAWSAELTAAPKGSDFVRGLVSVIMPAYNSAATIALSNASLMQQTYANWELIVIDDCSLDNTAKIAEDIAVRDPRVRVIRKAHNEGVALARNTGLGVAKGQYVSFLDSDDLWMPDKLSIQVQFMDENRAAFSFTSYSRFTKEGFVSAPVSIPKQVDYADLLYGNVIPCLTVLIDRTLVGHVEMSNVRHEDYATWLNLLRSGHRAYGIQLNLAQYRVSTNSTTANKLKSALWTWRIYREHEHFSWLRSWWCFMRYAARSVHIRAIASFVQCTRPSRFESSRTGTHGPMDT